MDDNLKLRSAQSEIAACEKELNEINEKMSGVNMNMISEKGPLINKHTQLLREKATTEGELNEIKVSSLLPLGNRRAGLRYALSMLLDTICTKMTGYVAGIKYSVLTTMTSH